MGRIRLIWAAGPNGANLPLSRTAGEGWRCTSRRFREDVVEGGAQGEIDLRHRRGDAKPRQRGDAVPRNLGIDTARHDSAKMVEIGIDVERDAVIADPVAHPDADRGDLVLAAIGAAGANHPYADAAIAPLAPDIEPRQRADHPLLEPPYMAAHVAPVIVQVEHDIGHPLSGPVIGALPAAAGLKDRQASAG